MAKFLKYIVTFGCLFIPRIICGHVAVVDTIWLCSKVGNCINPTSAAVDPLINHIYIGNYSTGNVAFINGENDSIVNVVNCGCNLQDICANQLTHRIYATITGGIAVVDGENGSLVKVIKTGPSPYAGPCGICINQITNTIYTLDVNQNMLWVVDGSSDSLVDSLPFEPLGWSICLNEATNRIYLPDILTDSIHIIDGVSCTIMGAVKVGHYPITLRCNSITNRIYVANRYSEDVSIIDGTTDLVIGTISIGEQLSSLCVDAKENLIYVASEEAQEIVVINGANNQIVEEIMLDWAPRYLACDDSFHNVYAVCSGNRVLIIDGLTYEVVNEIRLGSSPHGICSDDRYNFLYVADNSSNEVIKIDGSTDSVISAVRTEGSPEGTILNDSTGYIYVTNDGNVSVIERETGEIVTTIPCGFMLLGIDANPLTDRIYVADPMLNDIAVIDGANNTVLTWIEMEETPQDVCANEFTNMIYSANGLTGIDGTVSVIDGKVNEIITTIYVGGAPDYIAVNPQTNYIYAACGNTYKIWVIDGENNALIHSINIPMWPGGLCVNRGINRIYAAISGKGIWVIDGLTNQVIQTVPISANFWDICVNEITNRIYVTDDWEGRVYVLQDQTNVDEPDQSMRPTNTAVLFGGKPNPFSQVTQIVYRVHEGRCPIQLRIFDVTGRFIRTLVNEEQDAGSYNIKWDGKDDYGKKVGRGIYFCRLESGTSAAAKKLVKLR